MEMPPIHPGPNPGRTVGQDGEINLLVDPGFGDDIRGGEDVVFPANLHKSSRTPFPRAQAHSHTELQHLSSPGWICQYMGRRGFLLTLSRTSIRFRTPSSSSGDFKRFSVDKLVSDPLWKICQLRFSQLELKLQIQSYADWKKLKISVGVGHWKCVPTWKATQIDLISVNFGDWI